MTTYGYYISTKRSGKSLHVITYIEHAINDGSVVLLASHDCEEFIKQLEMRNYIKFTTEKVEVTDIEGNTTIANNQILIKSVNEIS